MEYDAFKKKSSITLKPKGRLMMGEDQHQRESGGSYEEDKTLTLIEEELKMIDCRKAKVKSQLT